MRSHVVDELPTLDDPRRVPLFVSYRRTLHRAVTTSERSELPTRTDSPLGSGLGKNGCGRLIYRHGGWRSLQNPRTKRVVAISNGFGTIRMFNDFDGFLDHDLLDLCGPRHRFRLG